MIVTNMLEKCPKCGKAKTVEIYTGLEPAEFDIEKYIYFCFHCGRVVKRLRNLASKEPDKYFEINFIKDEIKLLS